MSDFKAKMHQIQFRPGLRLRPRWGSLHCSPHPLAGWPTSKGEVGNGRGEGSVGEWDGWGKEGRGGGREGTPPVLAHTPPHMKCWIKHTSHITKTEPLQ